MPLVDLILNLAGLLLWLNWRSVSFDPLHTATPATLIGTLRRTEPARARRWHFLAALLVLLLGRALFYYLVGSALDWTATLNVLATSLAFRSDSFRTMLLFSMLSFCVWLLGFLLWLLLLSMLGRGSVEGMLPMRLARAHLGLVMDWSLGRKWLLPFAAAFVLWWLATWPLGMLGLLPHPSSELTRLAQACLVGLSSYLVWQYLIIAILTLYLLHNQIYFGRHPLWSFIDHIGRRLVQPLRIIPCRLGRLDLAPLIGIVLVATFAHLAEHGVRTSVRFDVHGRLERPSFEIPGLAGLYERISR